MAHQVPWNSVIYDEFCRIAMLSDIEQRVLETRIKGATVVEQSILFSRSPSTIAGIIRNLKCKYDIAQQYSDILPKRKPSAKEIYMDTH